MTDLKWLHNTPPISNIQDGIEMIHVGLHFDKIKTSRTFFMIAYQSSFIWAVPAHFKFIIGD